MGNGVDAIDDALENVPEEFHPYVIAAMFRL